MRAALLVPLMLLAAPAALARAPETDPRNLSWVTPGVLAVGGGGLDAEEVAWLHGEGFLAIADFRAEHSDPADVIAGKGMAFFDMPISSAADINETQLTSFLAWADMQVASGRPMYIHCQQGWHRAATFAMAWEMHHADKSADAAGADAVARRPGTIMRATGALLDLEARLLNERPLAVLLTAPASRASLGETLDASVLVHAGGRPGAGASVSVWSEEGGTIAEGVTDADGRFPFAYTSPATGMHHLNARASLTGFHDGGDNIEVYSTDPRTPLPPLDIHAERTPDGTVSVKVERGGKPVATRIMLDALHYTQVEATATGRARFLGVPMEGPVSVRAIEWGAPIAAFDLPAPALPRGETRAEADNARAATLPAEMFVPEEPPAADRGVSAPPPAALGAVIALAGALGVAALLLRRRKSARV